MNPKLLRWMALALTAGSFWVASGSAQSPLILDRELLLEQPPAEREETPVGVPTSPLPELRPGNLSPVALTYLVRMNFGGNRLEVQLERRVEAIEVDGQRCWRIQDSASTPGGEATDTIDLDAETLVPLRREAKGTGTIRLFYGPDAVTGEIGVGGDVVDIYVPVDSPMVGDGPGLEVTLAALPLRAGFTIAIRLFEPIERKVRVMQLAVTGEEVVSVPAGTFPTWVVELTSLDGNESGTATVSVMKETPHHVVKAKYRLPAQVGGGVMRTELTAIAGILEED